MRQPLLLQISVVLLLAGWTLLACAGSGGAGPTPGRGRLTITVSWPSSRAIPAATRSLKITAKVLEPEDGPQVASVVVQRPEGQSTSQLVLDDLPSVKVRLTATAHASSDGSGAVLAQGTKDVDVPEDASTSVSLVLNDAGGDGEIVFTRPDDDDLIHLGFCTEGHSFKVQATGFTNPAVTWSVTGGGTLGSFLGPTNGESSAEVHTGHTEGLFSITATSVEDPTIKATHAFRVDAMQSSGWGLGSTLLGAGPNPDGKYRISVRLSSIAWTVTRSGATFTGPREGGQPGEIISATLATPDRLTGFIRVKQPNGLEDQPFDFPRECFDTD